MHTQLQALGDALRAAALACINGEVRNGPVNHGNANGNGWLCPILPERPIMSIEICSMQRVWSVDAGDVDVKIDQDKTLYARLVFPSTGLDKLMSKVSERVETLKVRCCKILP